MRTFTSMSYFKEEKLTKILLFEAVVIKVGHRINDQGEVYLNIQTNKDIYLIDIDKSTNQTLDVSITEATIGVGDTVQIYLATTGEYPKQKHFLLWDVPTIKEKRDRLNLNFLNEVSDCPVCGEHLLFDRSTHKSYCINGNCPARLIFSIRKFLQVAAPSIKWELDELLVFNKLVTMGRIKSLPDIYTLTVEELTSLGVWFSYKEKEVGYSVYNKINKTRGTVTVYNYLNSLNVHKGSDWRLDKKEIDKKFESMADFIDAIGEELDTSMHKLKQCMSRETILTLRSYFIQDNALECVLRLAEEQVFDS